MSVYVWAPPAAPEPMAPMTEEQAIEMHLTYAEAMDARPQDLTTARQSYRALLVAGWTLKEGEAPPVPIEAPPPPEPPDLCRCGHERYVHGIGGECQVEDDGAPCRCLRFRHPRSDRGTKKGPRKPKADCLICASAEDREVNGTFAEALAAAEALPDGQTLTPVQGNACAAAHFAKVTGRPAEDLFAGYQAADEREAARASAPDLEYAVPLSCEPSAPSTPQGLLELGPDHEQDNAGSVPAPGRDADMGMAAPAPADSLSPLSPGSAGGATLSAGPTLPEITPPPLPSSAPHEAAPVAPLVAGRGAATSTTEDTASTAVAVTTYGLLVDDLGADLEQRERSRHMGSSDVPAIFGLSPYRTAIDVFAEKTGRSDSNHDTMATRAGRRLEPVLGEWYADETGRKLEKAQTVVLPDPDGTPWARATPDFLTVGDDRRIVECKTASLWNRKEWGEPGTDEVPDAYICQVLWQMFVVGIHAADLAVLIGGQDFRIYTIPWDEELARRLFMEARRFWKQHVLADAPPPLDGSESTRAYLRARFPRENDRLKPATPTVRALCSQYREAMARGKASEDCAEQVKAKLCEAIGDDLGFDLGGGSMVTWKSAAAGQADWKTIAAILAARAGMKDVPRDLIEAHKRAGTRRFNLTWKGDDE